MFMLGKPADNKLYGFARGQAVGGRWTSPVIIDNMYSRVSVYYADSAATEGVDVSFYDENGTRIGDIIEDVKSGFERKIPVIAAPQSTQRRYFYITVDNIPEELYEVVLGGDEPMVFNDFTRGMSVAGPPRSVHAQYLKNFLPVRGVVKGADSDEGVTIIGTKADYILHNPVDNKWYYLPISGGFHSRYPLLSNTSFDPYGRVYFIGVAGTEKYLYYIDLQDLAGQGAGLSINGDQVFSADVVVGGRVGFVSAQARSILDDPNNVAIRKYQYNSREDILNAARS